MIVANFKGNYGYEPLRVYNFPKMEGVAFHIGLHGGDRVEGMINVRFEIEAPNMFYMKNWDIEMEKYDYIILLCKYTADYLNEKYMTNKCHALWFPVVNYPYNDISRDIDVLYIGNYIRTLPFFREIYECMNKYTPTHHIFPIRDHSIQTIFNKINHINRTKIYIVHNVLENSRHLPKYRNLGLPFEKYKYVPQIKSRMFEGALMGCVLLVLRDERNLIEEFYVENEHFIYYNEGELDEKIQHILTHYDEYKVMGLKARELTLERYMVNSFMEQVEKIVKGSA
jgi:hypothetical protein